MTLLLLEEMNLVASNMPDVIGIKLYGHPRVTSISCRSALWRCVVELVGAPRLSVLGGLRAVQRHFELPAASVTAIKFWP